MSFFNPEIKNMSLEDAYDLLEVLDFAFPYVTFDKSTLENKIKSNNFYMIKHHQNNIMTGFLELEFLEDNVARLNAIFVEEAWRGQGFANKLMKSAVHECKRRRIHKIFLLVKEKNDAAKHLYTKRKFKFAKMHDKKLDGSKVEVWERHIN
jgi:ribosomal protein S18 acetylase RimI-like enzyme